MGDTGETGDIVRRIVEGKENEFINFCLERVYQNRPFVKLHSELADMTQL